MLCPHTLISSESGPWRTLHLRLDTDSKCAPRDLQAGQFHSSELALAEFKMPANSVLKALSN